ncbi:hypothetical protein BH23GEM2_BH23GEM2_06110 [soil metagenome]
MLSKSDFKLASSCEAKLYFRKNGFPDRRDSDEHLRMLALSGYMVEALAKASYPDGVELDYSGDAARACALTCERLQQDGATLFEGTLLWNRRLARADILQRCGDALRVIEVKSGSINGAAHAASLAKGGKGEFRSSRKPFGIRKSLSYLEDLTYQVLVAERQFPGLRVEPYLRLVDTSRYVGTGDVHGAFEMVTYPGRGIPRLQTVRFIGDPSVLLQLDITTEVSVAAEVAMLRDAVEARAARLETLLDAPFRDFIPARCSQCRDCEFRTEGDGQSGFRECWGSLAEVKPHVLDLHSIGTVKATDGTGMVEWLWKAGKASLFDIPQAQLGDGTGNPGSVAERQLRQIAHIRSETPWISDDLRSRLESVSYPAHFIDFEAANPALPYHAKMRPYGRVAFQWSSHRIDAPGAEPVHGEWLNSDYEWPNEQFLRTLRAEIGDTGTVFVWTGYEASTLRSAALDLPKRGVEDPALAEWVADVVSRRIIDMHAWTASCFYHPLMGGSASIKVVLDAIWKSEPLVRADFERLTGLRADPASDPYAALPAVEINGAAYAVREGTGAGRAYEMMLYGAGRTDTGVRSACRQLLLQYCRLDTLSMVLIFEHLRGAVATRGR